MEKMLKIVKLKDSTTDFNFWQNQSDVNKLKAIEILGQQYINFKKDLEPRLQRVYRIINKKQSLINSIYTI